MSRGKLADRLCPCTTRLRMERSSLRSLPLWPWRDFLVLFQARLYDLLLTTQSYPTCFLVLQMLESVSTRHIKGSNDWINKLNEELRKTTHLKSTLLTVSRTLWSAIYDKLVISFGLLVFYRCGRIRFKQRQHLPLYPETSILPNVSLSDQV